MVGVVHAAEFHQVAVHVQNALAARTFVKVVYVLGHQQKTVAQALFEFGEGNVCGVRLVFGESLAQEVVEVHDALRVTTQSAWRADVLDVFVFPHPVVSAEGAESGFCANSCARQYNQFLFHVFQYSKF